MDNTARFIFENITSRFGCPKSLTSDQGTHFINETISSFLQNFMIQHHRINLDQPQENGIVEAFNKILEKGLTKIFSANCDDLDLLRIYTSIHLSILCMDERLWYQPNFLFLSFS